MKRLILLSLSVALLALSTSFLDQPEANDILCFGVIKYDGNKVSGVSLKVFQNDELVNRVVTGRNIGYGFSLAYNTEYRIEFAKEGFLEQTILIDTHVPDEVIGYGDRILWEPDFTIQKIMPGLKEEQFDVPVAQYIFNKELWGFYIDKKYQSSVENEVSSILAENEILKKKAFSDQILRGDSLFEGKNFEEAIMAYTEAGMYNEEDKYSRDRIKETRKMLKKQYSAEEGYEKAIEKADDYFSEAEFDLANSYYQKAIIYLPKETYPLDMLYAIDSIRTYIWLSKVADYDSLVCRGDSLFGISEYEPSKDAYTSALTIFNKKEYPMHRILAIDSIQEAIRENERLLAAKAETENNETKEQEIRSKNRRQIENSLGEEQSDLQQPADTIMAEKSYKSEKDQKVDQEKKTVVPIRESSEEIGQEKKTMEEPQESLPDIAFKEDIPTLKQSLEAKIESGDIKGSSSVLEKMGQVYQREFRLGKALESYNESLELKQELGDVEGEIELLNSIASVLFDSGEYHAAVQKFETSLGLAKEISDEARSADIHENIAAVYENTFRYDEAVEELQKSRMIKTELEDKPGTGDIYKSLGRIYYEQNKFDKAVEELEKAVTIEADLGNKEQLGSSFISLGASWFNMKKYDKAETYYRQAIQTSEEAGSPMDKSIALNNLGNISFDQGNFKKAIGFYEQSLTIKEDLSFREGMASTLHNIGNSWFRLRDYEKALEYFTASMDISRELNYHELIWRNYEAFARTYAAIGDYRQAFENYRQYTLLKYEMHGESLQLTELREQYESGKLAVRDLRRELQKQSRIARYEAERNRREIQIIELEVANKQQQLKRQRIIIVFFIIGSILILGFSLLITKQYGLIRKAYRIVAEQQRNISEGINYAARIQQAVAPPEKYVQTILPDYFIINRPCEVVGGDFFLVAHHFGKTIVAVSDCTGHGVPGGFMSMLGTSLLNEILSMEHALETHEVLTQLRDRVVEALHQKGGDSESLDGMDISLIMIDPKKRQIQFSAAYHSIYLIKDGQLEKLKGDRIPIGFHFRHKPFTSETLQLKKGDMIYMTTDGYTDQIGEKTQSRFMMQPFRELLLTIHGKSVEEQKTILEKTLDDWKGKLPQTDDILVVGIRL